MRIRLVFSKGGPLRYTGNLDLHKIWERSFRRAELPLAYSHGFHPKPKIQLAAALPLGFSSRAELLDFWTSEEIDLHGLPGKLTGAMPAGLEILSVEQVDERAPALQTQVVSAEYRIFIQGIGSQSDLVERIKSILQAESIPRVRRGKKYDLRPLIEELRVKGKDQIAMRLAAREGATGRPEEVLAVLNLSPEEALIERTDLKINQSNQHS